MVFVYLPVPFRLEVCGLFEPLSDTCNVPVSVPTPVGVNSTSMVQLASEVRLDPQVVEETLNGPVVEITMLFRSTFRLFFRVNTFAELCDPTFVVANVAVAGVKVTCASPVPDNETVCGLFVALS